MCASRYKRELAKPDAEITKIPIAALQHTLSTPMTGATTAVDIKLAESAASYDRVSAFVDGMGLTGVRRHFVLLSVVAMRPTLLSVYGRIWHDNYFFLRAQTDGFNKRVARARRLFPIPTLLPSPEPIFQHRQKRAESLVVARLLNTQTFYVPYSYWVGELISPQSQRTIETIPVWLSNLSQVIDDMNSSFPKDSSSTRISWSNEAYLIHYNVESNSKQTLQAHFARFHLDSLEKQAFVDNYGIEKHVTDTLREMNEAMLRSDPGSNSDSDTTTSSYSDATRMLVANTGMPVPLHLMAMASFFSYFGISSTPGGESVNVPNILDNDNPQSGVVMGLLHELLKGVNLENPSALLEQRMYGFRNMVEDWHRWSDVPPLHETMEKGAVTVNEPSRNIFEHLNRWMDVTPLHETMEKGVVTVNEQNLFSELGLNRWSPIPEKFKEKFTIYWETTRPIISNTRDFLQRNLLELINSIAAETTYMYTISVSKPITCPPNHLRVHPV